MADGSTVTTSALRVAAIRFLHENDGNVAEASRALKAFLRGKLRLSGATSVILPIFE